MPSLSGEKIEQVLGILGYGGQYNQYQLPVVPQDLTDWAVGRIDSVLSSLEIIDQTILDALPDSLAKNIGELNLDFNTQIALNNRQGSTLLNELSRLINVPINYNKYQNTNKTSIKNYR